jgi:hypothetical protein
MANEPTIMICYDDKLVKPLVAMLDQMENDHARLL